MERELNLKETNLLESHLPDFDYFRSGTSKESLSFHSNYVKAGNSGEHELTITLGEEVEKFEYTSSGKSTLIITAQNPGTEFIFRGSGEQNILISGITDEAQISIMSSAYGKLEITKATPEAVKAFKISILQNEIAEKEREIAGLQKAIEEMQ